MKTTNLTGSMSVVVALISVLSVGTVARGGYPETILADNPVGYWRLGEASGSQATDSSTNGFHGTYTGGVTLGQEGAVVNPAPDAAVLFDGTSGYVDVGVESSLYSLPNAYSFEAWIKLPQDANFGMILSTRKYHSGTGGYGLAASSGELRFTTFGHHDYRYYYSFPVDEWTHVAAVAVFDPEATATTVSFYINGEWGIDLIGSRDYDVVAQPFNIGRNPDTDAIGSYLYFDGAIDEVAVYPYALTPTQIQNHYSVAPEPATLGLVVLVALTLLRRRRK